MRTSPLPAVADRSASPGVSQPQQAELVYRGLTLIAMALLLVTLFAF